MKARIIIHTMDGKKWKGDAEETSPSELEAAQEFLGNLKDMTRLSIPIDGHNAFFNPDNIVAAILVTEEK